LREISSASSLVGDINSWLGWIGLSINGLLGESVSKSNFFEVLWEFWSLSFLDADKDGRLDGDFLEGWEFGLWESDFERFETDDSKGLKGETSEATRSVDDGDLSVPDWGLLEEFDGWMSNGKSNWSSLLVSIDSAVGSVDSLDGDHVGFSRLADLGDKLGVFQDLGHLLGGVSGDFLGGRGGGGGSAGLVGFALRGGRAAGVIFVVLENWLGSVLLDDSFQILDDLLS